MPIDLSNGLVLRCMHLLHNRLLPSSKHVVQCSECTLTGGILTWRRMKFLNLQLMSASLSQQLHQSELKRLKLITDFSRRTCAVLGGDGKFAL